MPVPIDEAIEDACQAMTLDLEYRDNLDDPDMQSEMHAAVMEELRLRLAGEDVDWDEVATRADEAITRIRREKGY